MKVAVIEDNPNAKRLVLGILKQIKDVEVIGDASTIKKGGELIRIEKPDLAILDIELEDGLSFEILKQIDISSTKVIFTTSFEQYAIDAFKYSTIDYLIKPIDIEQFVNAVEKAKKTISLENSEVQIQTLLYNIQNTSKKDKKIVLNTSSTIHVIEIDNIIRCESEDSYTNFHLTNGKRIIVSKQLKEYDELLTNYSFVRSHKSHLVNLTHLDFFDKNKGVVVMTNNEQVPVSVRKKELILNSIKNLQTIK